MPAHLSKVVQQQAARTPVTVTVLLVAPAPLTQVQVRRVAQCSRCMISKHPLVLHSGAGVHAVHLLQKNTRLPAAAVELALRTRAVAKLAAGSCEPHVCPLVAVATVDARARVLESGGLRRQLL